MNNIRKIFVLWLAVVSILSSCKDDDKVDLPEITSVLVTDYPNIAFGLVKDSIPDTFVNSENLPAEAGKDSPIHLQFETRNFQSGEVYVSESKTIKVFTTDTVSLEYKPLYFIKINSSEGVSRVYAIRLIRTSPNDPQMISVDVDLDPTGNSPLAGIVKVTSDQQVKLRYTVKGQDGEDFSMETSEFAATQQIDLFGLYADYTNHVVVEITNNDGLRATKEFLLRTQPLPATVPTAEEITVNKADLVNSTTQFVMFYPIRTTGLDVDLPIHYYPVVVDRFGKVRYYLKIDIDNNTTLKKLNNGHWMHMTETTFTEVDLLGNIYAKITAPQLAHHDYLEMPGGDILYLASNLTLHNTLEDIIYRIGRDGSIKDQIDLYTLLDPTRPILPWNADARDWFHANSIYYVASDNSIVVSGRHQSAIVKIDLATKTVKWIFSDPTYWNDDLKPLLLTPTTETFDHTYGQHSVVLFPTDPTRLLAFDNGNGRSYTNPLPPSASFTRIVEYKIDGSNVTQTFEFGRQFGSQNFAPYVGYVGFIGDSKYFISYGAIYKDDAGNPLDLFDTNHVLQVGKNSVRFMEITNQGVINLDISINSKVAGTAKGIRSYRGHPFNFN